MPLGNEDHQITILDRRISVVSIAKDRYKSRVKVWQRPAALGQFTIRELQHMLLIIQIQPFRESHYFVFPHGRYIATVVNEESNQDNE